MPRSPTPDGKVDVLGSVVTGWTGIEMALLGGDDDARFDIPGQPCRPFVVLCALTDDGGFTVRAEQVDDVRWGLVVTPRLPPTPSRGGRPAIRGPLGDAPPQQVGRDAFAHAGIAFP